MPGLVAAGPAANSTEQRTRRLLTTVDHDLGERLANLTKSERARTGIFLGNATGHLENRSCFLEDGQQKGYAAVDAASFAPTMINHPATELGGFFSITGASSTIASGFASGLEAIGYAAMRIRLGKETLALAGGVGGPDPYSVGSLRQALSNTGSRQPFNQQHLGIVPSDGVGVLLLSSFREPHNNPSHPPALILASASSSNRVNQPPDEIERNAVATIREVIHASELVSGDIDAVFSSANGTLQDQLERDILQEVFGCRLHYLPVYATKTILGECFSASGPLSCIAALYGMHHGRASTHQVRARWLGGLLQPERIRHCESALVYNLGPDNSFAAMVLGRL